MRSSMPLLLFRRSVADCRCRSLLDSFSQHRWLSSSRPWTLARGSVLGGTKTTTGTVLDIGTSHHASTNDHRPWINPGLTTNGQRHFMHSTTLAPTSAVPSSWTVSTLTTSPESNIPLHIAERVVSSQPKLYQTPPHPLHTLKQRIEAFFPTFQVHDDLSPIVSTQANFDSLLIPPNHVSRSRSDTYYLNPATCLRTHTSAHQSQLLQQGYTQFLCTGDVYRRDDIDKSHYPIFHQMEGVKVFDTTTSDTTATTLSEEEILQDLKSHLEQLAQHLFGPVPCRWVEEYFPFTHPSLELEIWYQDEWLEVLGCGVMQPQILRDAGLVHHQGWAFGLGLERLAMVLFQIPDIRLFWSHDERFWNQFQPGQITTFQPYSKYPPCFKDISFWINNNDNDNANDTHADATNHPPATTTTKTSFHVNDVLDLTRQVAGDLVEEVKLVDQFVHPKTLRESHCYRITYRSMDRSLTNAEIDVLQETLRSTIAQQLDVELR